MHVVLQTLLPTRRASKGPLSLVNAAAGRNAKPSGLLPGSAIDPDRRADCRRPRSAAFWASGELPPLPWRIMTYDTALGGYMVDLDSRRLGAPTCRGARLAYLSRTHRRLLRHPTRLTGRTEIAGRRRFPAACGHSACLCRQRAFFDWPDSDMAMATACLRLRTFLPELLFSVPFLCSCITL